MGEEKVYQVVVTTPAKNRYQLHVLPYLHDNFSFERATEIDENILSATGTLDKKLIGEEKKNTCEVGRRNLGLFYLRKPGNLNYYVNKANGVVYVTDFFSTKMNPQSIMGSD